MAGKPMKMVIGQAGKQYGLFKPGAAKPAAKPVASIFGDDDDVHDVDPSKVVQSDKHREKMQKRAEKEMAKALEQDASIFDYDGALDGIKEDRQKEAEKVKGQVKKREVRYVHSLLAKTQERKKEDERLFEKRLIAELKAEEEEQGGSEKFVTSAYKAQLQANKKWELEQKMRDELAARDDVTKKEGLTDFYSSMLRGTNAATGAARGSSPPKDATKPEEKEYDVMEHLEDEETGDFVSQEYLAKHGAAAVKAEIKEEEEELKAKMPATQAAESEPQEERGSLMPSAAEAGIAPKPKEESGAEIKTEGEEKADGAEGAQATEGAEAEVGSKRKYDGWVATAYGYVKEKPKADAMPAEVHAKKSEETVLSAKERYLQRKREKEQAGKK